MPSSNNGGMSTTKLRGSVLTAICVSSFVCAVVLFFSGQTPYRLTQSLEGAPVAEQGLAYVKHRPFDALGWIAYAESMSTTSHDSAKREYAAVSAALTLSPSEPRALLLSAKREFGVGSTARGLEVAATLALVSPADRTVAFDLLRSQIGAKAWNDFFVRKIDENWPLTDSFAQHVCASESRAGAILSHQLAWEISKRRPLSPSTLLCVEGRLVENGRTAAAYQLRLSASKTLTKRFDFVYNGSFETPPSGSAFDWTVNAGGEYREGFVATIRNGVELNNLGAILHVRFTGQPIRGAVATQTLALEPGRYRFSYRSREVGIGFSKSPVWTIRCLPSQDLLSSEPWENIGSAQDWTTRATTFSVPAQCTGQSLRLEAQTRLSALEGLRGTFATDDLIISR